MKKLLILFLFSGLFCRCNQNKVAPEQTKNEAFIQQYFQHFNKHDWAKMAQMYANQAEFKDPSLGPGVVKQSHEQIVAKYTALSNMFPDVKDEVIKMYPAGEKNLVVEFVSTGTAPDSSKFELPICTIFTFENGKITRDFTYYDNFEE